MKRLEINGEEEEESKWGAGGSALLKGTSLISNLFKIGLEVNDDEEEVTPDLPEEHETRFDLGESIY